MWCNFCDRKVSNIESNVTNLVCLLSIFSSCFFLFLFAYSSFIISAGDKIPEFKKDAGFDSLATLDELRNAKGTLPTADIRMTMQKHMQDNAAVYRTQVW